MPFIKPIKLTKIPTLIKVLLVSSSGLVLANLPVEKTLASTIYNVSLDASKFGYLLQNDTVNGPEDCGPTSATNSFIFLQNQYPELYKNSLAGASYQDWEQTGNLLASSYIRTVGGGATPSSYIIGTEVYFDNNAPNTTSLSGQIRDTDAGWLSYRPNYIQNEAPTWQFLYNQLSQNAPVNLGIYAGWGHFITLVGMNWIDANEDGIINPEENATITFIDPLDPANKETIIEPTMAVPKVGQIYQNSPDGYIQLDYLRRYLDQGEVKSENVVNAKISMSFSLSAQSAQSAQTVPEPSSEMALKIFGLGILVAYIKRRCSKTGCFR